MSVASSVGLRVVGRVAPKAGRSVGHSAVLLAAEMAGMMVDQLESL
jgi:hypothetical protein